MTDTWPPSIDRAFGLGRGRLPALDEAAQEAVMQASDSG